MTYAPDISHLADPAFVQTFGSEFEELRNLHPSDIAEVLEESGVQP
jgi:hypothetical protein